MQQYLATLEEQWEAVFSMWSAPRTHKGTPECRTVEKSVSYLPELWHSKISSWVLQGLEPRMTALARPSSNLSDPKTVENYTWIWRLAVWSQFSSARELAAEGSTNWSQWSEYRVDMRWSTPWEDMSLEAEECPSLEAVTKQRDWGYYSVHDSDLQSIVASCKIVQ
jgi:hypothetical protein